MITLLGRYQMPPVHFIPASVRAHHRHHSMIPAAIDLFGYNLKKIYYNLPIVFKGHISGQSYRKENSLVYYKMPQWRLRVDWWTEGERGTVYVLLYHAYLIDCFSRILLVDNKYHNNNNNNDNDNNINDNNNNFITRILVKEIETY